MNGESYTYFLRSGSSGAEIKVWAYEPRYELTFRPRCIRQHSLDVLRLTISDPGGCVLNPMVDRGPDGALPVGRGESVFARWSDGKWYPGRVTGFDSQGRIQVSFLDGDRGDFLPNSVRRDGLDKGSFVTLRRSTGPRRLQIVERYGDALIVSMGRGRRNQAVSMAEVVFDEAPAIVRDPVSRNSPRTLINACNRTSERLYASFGILIPRIDRLSTEGWLKIAAGQCEIVDHTAFVLRELSSTRGADPDPTNPNFAYSYYYAQNEAAFERYGQAVGFAPSAQERRYEGDNADLSFCTLQLPNVAFRHVLDESAAGLGAEQYCTDLSSARVVFRELAQNLNAVETGQVLNVTFE